MIPPFRANTLNEGIFLRFIQDENIAQRYSALYVLFFLEQRKVPDTHIYRRN